MFHVPVLLLLAPAATPAIPMEAPAAEVRQILGFLVRIAEENQLRSRPVAGDALADHYVCRMTAFTAKEKLSPRALLVALGIGLDRTDVVRSHRLAGLYLKRMESDAERQQRLKALGRPTLHGREDWLQHFAVSAALTSMVGPSTAEQIGVWKELRDVQGESGFSFTDLAADNAGICFARMLLDPKNDSGPILARVAKEFRGARVLPDMKKFEDGLTRQQLLEKYGESTDPRFVAGCRKVREAIENLPAFKELQKKDE